MDSASILARLGHHAANEDPELVPFFEGATLDVVSTRPMDSSTGKRLGVLLRLSLGPRDLGRVLASASLQDRLTTVVAESVGDDADELLLDLSFGCTHGIASRSHPYRGRSPVAASGDASAVFLGAQQSVVDSVRALIEGYFCEQSSPPSIEVSAFADEILIAIDAETMIFAQLAPALRDAAMRIAPKVLLQRARKTSAR